MLKSIVSVIALVAFAATPAAFAVARPNPLEGVFDSQVTLTDCNGYTLAVFRAYEMFHAGGTLSSTDNTPPTFHGPGFGTWERVAGRKYSSPFQFFNFNPDGSFAGTQRIDRTITLSADGNSYTSTVTFQSFDPDGNLLFSGCGSETAARLQ